MLCFYIKFPATKVHKPYVKRVRTETVNLATAGLSTSQESSSTSILPAACPITDSAYEGDKGLDVFMASPPKNDSVISSHDQEKEKKEEFIARAKQGWTLANVESIKIGELYLIVSTNIFFHTFVFQSIILFIYYYCSRNIFYVLFLQYLKLYICFLIS